VWQVLVATVLDLLVSSKKRDARFGVLMRVKSVNKRAPPDRRNFPFSLALMLE
jgi:hypothetical protein